jgi:hypothetical protein
LQPDKRPPHFISIDGTVFFDRGNTKIFIRPDGSIWEKSGEVWTTTTCEGQVYVDCGPIRRNSFTLDNALALRMVRQDSIGYLVSSPSTRTITYLPDSSVEQTPDGLTFDIPDFPVILMTTHEIEFQIDKFTFHISKSGTGSVLTDTFKATFDQESFKAESEVCQVRCSARECEIVVGDSRVYGNADGDERYEIPKTLTNLHIFKTTPPSFFCVRNDLSVVEFLRPDSPVFQQGTHRSSRIPSPLGGFVKIKSIVPEDPQVPVSGFVEHTAMDQTAVQRIVGNFDITLNESEKIATDVAEASVARTTYLRDIARFENGILQFLEDRDDPLATEFQLGQFMPEVSPVFQARETPRPRLLESVYFKRQKMVFELGDGDIIPYWESRESDFALG